jgi:AraC-like DNA-binding protein
MSGTVSVLLVRPIAPMLSSDALAAADLTTEMLADNEARVTAAQFCIAWAEALRCSGDRALALRLAAALPPGTFGIVEYVCRAAPTLGVALQRWVRYLNLLDDAVVVGLATPADDDRAYLRLEQESEAPAPASHELCFAMIARQGRELCGPTFQVTRVDLASPAPDEPVSAAFRAWFGAPIAWSAERHQLVLPASALALPIASSDPALLGILTRAADDLLARASNEPPLVAQVRRALHDTLRTGEASIDLISQRLGITPRSLQRRLRDEGTAFADLREAVRRELAQRYLDEGLTIAEISFLLGFSEPSAFFRAFKRWTGETPRRRIA